MPAPADRVRCTDPKAYKTQARNIFASIDAADNPTFRLRVLTGQIPATAVATLQAGAMASAEQQAKNSKIDQDALYHGQAAQAEPTEGIFQCGKCKSDKVRFALAQVSRRVSVRVYRGPILLQFVSTSCALAFPLAALLVPPLTVTGYCTVLQTRSGDEPMTVFCSCVTCGNRWKFS